MARSDDNVLYENTTDVKTGKYTLRVSSVETHWPGDGSGGMEGMPGDFLQQEVRLVGCKKPSDIESIALRHKVVLSSPHQLKKETTSEPPGYAELKHNHLVAQIQEDASHYLKNIQKAAKEVL